MSVCVCVCVCVCLHIYIYTHTHTTTTTTTAWHGKFCYTLQPSDSANCVRVSQLKLKRYAEDSRCFTSTKSQYTEFLESRRMRKVAAQTAENKHNHRPTDCNELWCGRWHPNTGKRVSICGTVRPVAHLRDNASPSGTSVDINHKCFRYCTESTHPLCNADTTIPDIIMSIFCNFSLSMGMLTHAVSILSLNSLF
jgi:hypothetical protein